MSRNQRRRTRSQTSEISQHNIHQCLNQGQVCGRMIHARLFGGNGKEFIDCGLHQDRWYPCLLDSTMGNWYHGRIMLYITLFGLTHGDTSRRSELSRAVLDGMMAVQEMMWDGIVTGQGSQDQFTGLGTTENEWDLEQTSPRAMAHFVFRESQYNSITIFTCDATAHHLAEVNGAWLAEGANPLSEHDDNPLYSIIGPVLLSLHMHRCVIRAFDHVRELQAVIRRWTRLALVCKSWLHGATDRIKSLIAERNSFKDTLEGLILGLGTGECYHSNPTQVEGLDEMYLGCTEQVLEVALGLRD